MKLALRPRLLPPALEYRWTRVFGIAGLTMTFAAAVMALLRPDPMISVGFAAGAACLFALGFRGRAEHLEQLSLALMADRENARRLEVVGLATAGFAHELKNALTVMKGFAELAKRAPPEKVGERIAEVDAQASRLIAELHGFLALSRPGPSERMAPLGVVLHEVANLLGPLAHLRELTFESDIPDGIERPVHDPGLRRALLNLGLNALQAAKTKVRLTARLEGEEIALQVEDDGPGVDVAVRSLLFTPFASGRADGTGLGLVQVREAATQEGGRAAYEPNAPNGACFLVRLPATLSPPTATPVSV